MNKIIIRGVRAADHAGCCAVEAACFPPDEAAGPESVRLRIERFPQGFLVAEAVGDVPGQAERRSDGKILGMINGGCTDKPDLADEAFKQLVGHDPAGGNMVVFSLSVLPQFRGLGLGERLMRAYAERSRELGKAAILLLCKPPLVPFYARFGFADQGVSPSTHGGAVWHEMRLRLSCR